MGLAETLKMTIEQLLKQAAKVGFSEVDLYSAARYLCDLRKIPVNDAALESACAEIVRFRQVEMAIHQLG